ncbi:hypothetical protein [Panacagrimonas perspica]|nr:hypothetical protein [Panacagrimonas perspica]
MTFRHPRLLAAAALLIASMPLAAATPPAEPAYAPYLDCAASRANYAFLLRSSNYKDAADLRKVEDNVQAYLRIATALAGHELRTEFKAAAEKVGAREEEIMKTKGAEAYLQMSADTEQLCVARVERNKAALLKAMDAYETKPAKK